MKNKPLIISIILLFSIFTAIVSAADKNEQLLIIGTKVAPPFVMKNQAGEFHGISIDLWKEMAKELDVAYRFEEAELPLLISGLQDGQYHASIAAITVTANREKLIDFTHPYFTTGLAIAATKSDRGWLNALSGVFSWQFIGVLFALCMLLLAVGFVLWLFERKKNQEMFGGSIASGLGASFWWAAVTMTTVGYGDKAPTTLGGRVVGLIWMFMAIILISGFTAAIASSLTVSHLGTSIKSVDDLYGANVVTIDNSASEKFLTSISVKYKTADDITSALAQLESGKIDAVVYDKPILRYLTNASSSDNLYVLPGEIGQQDYAIGLPNNSPLREKFNERLLQVIESERWEEIKSKYLGGSPL
ncbi:amino acid ABC transporter substrate-binding protein, PAAT family [Colwellia chukchiensis]|uniref:Amino acid ABC transporter substrate-binding protein, PAAT family n=1 Tax=Colwellia chukchiensis TaxID=641665 RepID=A0A1H7MSN5_9GAMM|nr:transporter substrate-binding domain-containing protein [Colwellia chukchiensis]SEL14223.1 amino acid ABC transporter substrate-binding protein, PAAT family [Colwellia chukchiensis]